MKLFITGTDTNIGKTYFSQLLLKRWSEKGFYTIGLKPVSSGAKCIEGEYKNTDACLLQKASSVSLKYAQVNAYCLKEPTAPSIAAQKERIELKVSEVVNYIKSIEQIKHDRMLIEGAGGLMVPFNEKELQLDLMKALNYPVVIVIGLRLGCINHALLSINVLTSYNIPIKGWVINHIDSQASYIHETIKTLKNFLKSIPYLGYIPFNSEDTTQINWHKLL